MGNWYVNRFNLGRRKAFIFMGETTLLSFILFQGKKPVNIESLNDLVNHYQWRVEREGGLSQCDLTGIIMSVNDMPQRRIGWQTSWDAAQGKLCLPN